MRYSHIFSSAVREVLETNLLKEASPLPLTITQFHLLKLMTHDGHYQVGEVAEVLGMSPPAATKNVDKLEGLGLLIRSADEDDRRAVILAVSAKGKRIVRRYEELKSEFMAPMLEAFNRKEVETMADLLERFSISLLQLDPPGAEVCLRCAAYIEDDCAVGEVCGGCPYMKFRESNRDEGSSGENS